MRATAPIAPTSQKMLNTLKEHPGKASAIASGGLSISVALMMFATKGEVDLLKQQNAETWRELQDIRMVLMQRASNTNAVNHIGQ